MKLIPITKAMGLFTIALAVAGLINTTSVYAEYPEKSITIIVPYSAGGATDRQARRIQGKLEKLLGQSIVIDNKKGSGGHIGTAYVAKSKPDGYTLIMNSGPTMVIGRSLYANLGYDPLKDLRGVTITAFSVEVIVARNDLKANNVSELIALAKANPGKITHASPGIGTVGHMAAEMLKAKTGIKMLHVPYKGSSPAVLALLKGEVDLYFSNLSSALSHIKAGKFKAIGNAVLDRHKLIPNVQTVAEAGFKGFAATPWYGVWAPTGTPDNIVKKLNGAFLKALGDDKVKKALEDLGQWVEPLTPSQLDKLLADEDNKWGKLVAGAGLSKVK
jgi:tripartite-type tricarboxylate transporter receptor subunit TctC